MVMMEHKMMASLAVLLGATDYLLINFFTKTGIGFSTIFDWEGAIKLVSVNTAVLIVIMALVMALSIYFILFFSQLIEKKEVIIPIILSSLVIMVVFVNSFSNKVAFLLISAFSMLGLIWIADTQEKKPNCYMDKIRIALAAAGKMTKALAVGGLVTALLITYSNAAYYQDLTKQSIVSFTTSTVDSMNMSSIIQNMNFTKVLGSIDITEIMTQEQMDKIVRESVTRDQIEQMIIQQLGESTYDSMTQAQKDELIESTYNATITQMMKQFNTTEMQTAYNSMTAGIASGIQTSLLESEQFKAQQREMSLTLIEQMIDQMPLMKKMFELLPIIIALTVMTAMSMFGQFLVTPMTAVVSLTLPREKKKEKEE